MVNYIFLIAVIAIVLAIICIAAFGNFVLDDEHYDRLKYLVERWAAITTFVGLLAKTFSFSYGVETVTIVAGIGALLKGILDKSAKNYYSEKPQDDFNYDAFLDMVDFEDTAEHESEVVVDESQN